MKESHKTNSFFGLSLSGSLGLVVRTWTHEVRGVIFHTTRWTQCRTRRCDTADCGCGQLHCTATENRTYCDHGRHRPGAVQVEKLSARSPRTARKPPSCCGNRPSPVRTSASGSYVRWATRCHWQAVRTSRGLPCLTPLTGGVVVGQEGGCTSPDKRQVP